MLRATVDLYSLHSLLTLCSWLPPLSAGLSSASMIAYGAQVWDCIRRWGYLWCLTHCEWVWVAAHRVWWQNIWLSDCEGASLFLYTLVTTENLEVYSQALQTGEVVIAYACSNGFITHKEGYMLPHIYIVLKWSMNAVPQRKGRETYYGHF